MVPQRICHAVEKLGDLFVRFIAHCLHDLLDQVRLVSAAGLDDQFAR
jgi:hypothetical protein